MHPLEKEILHNIRREGLISPGDIVVVGVSGGADSICLLHLLARLSQELDCRLVAAHVDHGLRPREAEAEIALVAKQVGGLGLELVSCQVDVRQRAVESGISLEHAAREMRYEFFRQMALEAGAGRIAVAHHADDQAEEVLLRLIRGTARAGLSGMRMLRDNSIIRPLLNIPKERLLDYLNKKNIAWCEDSSNSDPAFLRNRIRHEALPFLRNFNPAVAENLRQTASVLQAEDDLLHHLVVEAWSGMVVEGQSDDDVPHITLELAPFLACHLALRRRIVEMVFIKMAGRPSFRKISQVMAVAAESSKGARLHFNRGLRLQKTQNALIFSYPQGQVAVRGNIDPEK